MYNYGYISSDDSVRTSTLKSKIVIVLKQHELAENWYKHMGNVEQWDTCMLVMKIKLMKNIAFLKAFNKIKVNQI